MSKSKKSLGLKEDEENFLGVVFKIIYKPEPTTDLKEELNSHEPIITAKLNELLVEHHALKYHISVIVSYQKLVDEEVKDLQGYLTTSNKTIYNQEDVTTSYAELSQHIMERNAGFMREGSGLTLHNIEKLELDVAKCKQLRG